MMDSKRKSSSEGRKIKDEEKKKSTNQPHSSKKCNTIPLLEDGPWKRTIKATISDIRKDKVFYCLYFEDEDIGLQEYEEESMLLDGLHKWLYVTFKDEKTARKAFKMEHDPMDSNILKVEMASPEDFDTYANLLFLYGFDIQSAEDADTLKDIIYEFTDLEVINFENHDESKAVVITFDDETCTDITPLTWSLTSLNGVKMITAPVYRKNSLLVSGLNETIPQSHLERYMKNKKRSGGGPIQSLQYLSVEEAVIIFENEADFISLQLKDVHTIGEVKLNVIPIYPCLIKSYLYQLNINVSTSHATKTQPPTVKDDIRKLNSCPSDNNTAETEFSESLDLKEEELSLLEKSDCLSKLTHTSKAIKILFEHEKKSVRIKGNLKREIQGIILQILNICRNNIRETPIFNLTPEQQQYIRNGNVLPKLNSLLPNAYLKCISSEFKLFYMMSADFKTLTDIVESQISMKKKPLKSHMVVILQSSKCQTFISDLIAAADKTQVCPFVKVDAEKKILLMLGPKDSMYCLEKEIDRFLELNQVIVKEIPFSEGKQNFVRQYLQEEFDEIKHCIGDDVEINLVSDKYIVKGLQDPVEECYRKLTYLSNKIAVDMVQLNYYGIQEFLQEHEGNNKLKEVEEKYKCVITTGFEEDCGNTFLNQTTEPQTLVLKAKAEVEGKMLINFMLGNILDLKVDAVVNPLDSTCKLRSGLSKAILKQGGNRILTELNSSAPFKGIVRETTYGNLSNIKSILHVKFPYYKTPDLSELKVAIMSCLEFAARQDYQSIAFTAVGTDRFLKFPLSLACKCLIKEILEYSESERTSLTNIYLCEYKDDVLNELIDSYKNFSTNTKLETFLKFNKKERSVNQTSKNFSRKGKIFHSINSKNLHRESDLNSFLPLFDKGTQPDCSSDSDDQGASYQPILRSIKKTKANDILIKFGRVKLKITNGNIFNESECDVIVKGIKDNMDLSLSGQVGNTLFDSQYNSFRQDYTNTAGQNSNAIAVYHRRGRLAAYNPWTQSGGAVTLASEFSSKKIIYVIEDTFVKCWDIGLTNVLQQANRLGATSLALPAFGAGSYRADVKRYKKRIYVAIENFAKKNKFNIVLIKLVISDKKVFDVFMEHQGCDSSSDEENEKSLSDGAVITIFSQNAKIAKDAIWDIKSFCKKLYKNFREEDDPMAKKLNKDQVKALKKFGVKQGVKVTIKTHEGVVTIQGFNTDGIYQVQKKLQTFFIESLETPNVLSVSPSGVWQFKAESVWNNQWSDFQPFLNCDLDHLHLTTQFGIITFPNGDQYEIDFTQMTLNITSGQSNADVDTYYIQRVAMPAGKKRDMWGEYDSR